MRKKNLHCDFPVDGRNDLSVTLQQYASLPLIMQNDITARGFALSGDHGVTNPDINYVPPYCRRGVTMCDLLDMMSGSDARIKQACHKLVQHQRRYGESWFNLMS